MHIGCSSLMLHIGYRGPLGQSSVHGWGVKICCPAFLCETSDNTWPRMTMPERTSLEPAKQCCAHWLVSSFIRHVYNFNMSMKFWTAGLTHYNGIKKPPVPRCSVAGDIDADPSAPNHQYSEYAKPKPALVLICRWHGTHSLLMKAFSSSKCDI